MASAPLLHVCDTRTVYRLQSTRSHRLRHVGARAGDADPTGLQVVKQTYPPAELWRFRRLLRDRTRTDEPDRLTTYAHRVRRFATRPGNAADPSGIGG